MQLSSCGQVRPVTETVLYNVAMQSHCLALQKILTPSKGPFLKLQLILIICQFFSFYPCAFLNTYFAIQKCSSDPWLILF